LRLEMSGLRRFATSLDVSIAQIAVIARRRGQCVNRLESRALQADLSRRVEPRSALKGLVREAITCGPRLGRGIY
jgi:hypothetical protein